MEFSLLKRAVKNPELMIRLLILQYLYNLSDGELILSQGTVP
ncbi:transposase [Anaerosalibacter sp. Marseille-P3206]